MQIKKQIFFKDTRKKLGIRERNWAEAKFSAFFQNGGTKPVYPGEKLGRDRKFGFFSKSVGVNDTHRERNLMGTQWR